MVLVEQRDIGGTCVNVGCVPKKVMFNLAMFLEDSQLAMPMYGVKGLERLSVDFSAFKQARDAYIKRLHEIYHRNLSNSGVEFVKGYGSFVDDKIVQVAE